MTAFDLEMAKTNHLRWRLLLESYLEGRPSLSEDEVLYCTDCELGKWIYGEGLEKYGRLPAMQELVRVHSQLHHTVEDVVELRI